MQESQAQSQDSQVRSSPVLRRRRDDRVIAGVASGVARYLGVDPVLIRLAFVGLGLATGVGVVLYIVGWLVIPEEQPGDETGSRIRHPAGRHIGAAVAGAALVLIGGLILLERLAPWFDGRLLGPVVVILVGLVILGGGLRS